MAQPKDFLYSLTDKDGRSYRVNNGIVDVVNTPAPLPVTPDGWQEKSIQYSRNVRSSGMWRTFTTPLKYVKQGAHILRHIMYTLGTEFPLYQVIHRLDKSFGGGWIHKFFYKGELDLSQFDDTQDTHVTCNIMEGDLIKQIKANENTVYEIPMDIPEALDVKMDGHRLKQKAAFLISDGTKPELSAHTENHIVELILLNSESLQSVGAKSTTRTQVNTSAGIFNSKENFLSPSISTDITVKWDYGISLSLVPGSPGALPNPHYRLRLAGFDKDGNETLDIGGVELLDYTADPLVFYGHHTFSGSMTVTIPEGTTELYLRSTVNNLSAFTSFVYDTEGTFDVEYFYRHRTTFIKALTPMMVGQKLLDKMTNNGGYAFGSTYLSDKWANLLLTSGDAIRGFENPKLKISWSEFVDSYNVPCNIAWFIRENSLRVEKKADVFQPTIQQNMGEVKGLNPKTAKDYQYNRLQIGYPDTDPEDINGRDAFNVTHLYTTTISRSSRPLEIISKVIADHITIELLRINLDGKTTTDNNNDNKAFFLLVEPTPTGGTGYEPAVYRKLLRETYTSITGIISPDTAFNIPLSPKRCVQAHGNFLRSVFYWQEGTELVFQTSNKNAELKTVKDGITIEEKANVVIGNLAAPLFIPLLFEFESPMAKNIIETMDAGPDGTFAGSWDGDPFYGFPMQVSIQPSDRPAQKTTLLCSPLTDLSKFIHG